MLTDIVDYSEREAKSEFYRIYAKLRDIIETKSSLPPQIFNITGSKIKTIKDVRDALLDSICKDNEIHLKNGLIKFPDRHSLWTLINEILINEEYYFKTNTDSPYILDCGTHFGLGIYYFKSIYPKAKILGFEPVPHIRELALKNIHRNKYSDVDILPYALSNEEKETTFYISKTYSMAGSLTDRRRHFGDEITEIKVRCRKLSKYIKKPVHFLKMDIEGYEDLVLEESEPFLCNIQYISCEYHQGMGLDSKRLGKILLLLDKAGFDTHLNKTFNFENTTRHRPLNFVDEPYSAVIWGKNRNWEY